MVLWVKSETAFFRELLFYPRSVLFLGLSKAQLSKVEVLESNPSSPSEERTSIHQEFLLDCFDLILFHGK